MGPIVLRSQTDLAWFALSSSEGWFYEWEYDTLVAKRDLVVSNRSTVLFEFWRGAGEAILLAGFRDAGIDAVRAQAPSAACSASLARPSSCFASATSVAIRSR